MTKTLFASLIAAGLFSATAAMANTSADSAPDRLPAATSSSSMRHVPSPAESAAISSMAWEGGQAGTATRSMTARQPMARTAGSWSTSTAAMVPHGSPYDSGAAN